MTPIGVVLGDANVLYSRVLRDYLLYAMTRRLIRVRWSGAILAEAVEHLALNVEGFDEAAGERLVTAMNRAFPQSEVVVDDESGAVVADLALPDEEDRHVLAAAVAAEADILCTDNLKDFPVEAMNQLGIELMSADALLSLLVTEFPEGMLATHRIAVSRFPGGTDSSTLAALRRAGAVNTADLMVGLLGA